MRSLICLLILLSCVNSCHAGDGEEGGMQIRIARVAALASEVDVVTPSLIAVDSSGGTFFLVNPSDHKIEVFGIDGRLARAVGRKGGAPGEFEMIRNLMALPDGAFQIVDPLLSRRSIYDRNGAFKSSARIGLLPAFDHPVLMLPSGQLLANSLKAIPPDTVATLQLLDPDGSVVKVFESSLGDPSQQWRVKRHLWRRLDGSILVADPFVPELKVYSGDLVLRQTIPYPEGTPIKAPLEGKPSDGVFDRPLTPRLIGMWEDLQGLIWLVTLAPSPQWQPRDQINGISPEMYRKLGDRPRVATVLEAFDPASGRLVSRLEVDSAIGVVFDRGFVAKQTEIAEGISAVVVSRINLQ